MEYKLDVRYVLCKFTRVHNTKADATQLCKIFSSPVLLFSNEQKLSTGKQKICCAFYRQNCQIHNIHDCMTAEKNVRTKIMWFTQH